MPSLTNPASSPHYHSINDLPAGWGVGKVPKSEELESPATGEGANHVGYDNTISGLLAVDVKAAIDELKASISGGGVGGTVLIYNSSAPTAGNVFGTWAALQTAAAAIQAAGGIFSIWFMDGTGAFTPPGPAFIGQGLYGDPNIFVGITIAEGVTFTPTNPRAEITISGVSLDFTATVTPVISGYLNLTLRNGATVTNFTPGFQPLHAAPNGEGSDHFLRLYGASLNLSGVFTRLAFGGGALTEAIYVEDGGGFDPQTLIVQVFNRQANVDFSTIAGDPLALLQFNLMDNEVTTGTATTSPQAAFPPGGITFEIINYGPTVTQGSYGAVASATPTLVPATVMYRTIQFRVDLQATGVNPASVTLQVETGPGTTVYNDVSPWSVGPDAAAIPHSYGPTITVPGGCNWQWLPGGAGGVVEALTTAFFVDVSYPS